MKSVAAGVGSNAFFVAFFEKKAIIERSIGGMILWTIPN